MPAIILPSMTNSCMKFQRLLKFAAIKIRYITTGCAMRSVACAKSTLPDKQTSYCSRGASLTHGKAHGKFTSASGILFLFSFFFFWRAGAGFLIDKGAKFSECD